MRRVGAVESVLWMIVISMALFFLPVVNGIIGGAVGGSKAASVPRALAAGVLAAVVTGPALWFALAWRNAPTVAYFGRLTDEVWALLSSLGTLLGAALGGAIARGPTGVTQSKGEWKGNGCNGKGSTRVPRCARPPALDPANAGHATAK